MSGGLCVMWLVLVGNKEGGLRGSNIISNAQYVEEDYLAQGKQGGRGDVMYFLLVEH